MTDSIPSWAVPGAKCVCINSEGWFTSEEPFTPITGGPRYKEICLTELVTFKGVWLRGWNEDVGLDSFIRQFRPLAEPKTEAHDLAKFAHHLRTPASILERLDALAERLNS